MHLLMFLNVVIVSMRVSCCTSCKASSATIAYVLSCPTSEEDWNKAAQRKNCSAAEQNCTTTSQFVYHCLPNSEQDRLIEVCSLPEVIAFPVCAEFSEEENRILENHLTDCSVYTIPCPTRYISTEAYKYPGCFNVTLSTTTVSDESTLFERPSTVERTQFPIVNGATSNDAATHLDLFYVKHQQLLLSFIITLGIVVPVVSFILVACAFSTEKSDNSTASNQPEPVEVDLLGVQSPDSAGLHNKGKDCQKKAHERLQSPKDIRFKDVFFFLTVYIKKLTESYNICIKILHSL